MAQMWDNTVTIEMRGAPGAYSRIETTEDAARYLLDHWTPQRTGAYQAAIQYCAKALRGEVSKSAAYLLFMTAAREARLSLVMARASAGADLFETDLQQALAESVLSDGNLSAVHAL